MAERATRAAWAAMLLLAAGGALAGAPGPASPLPALPQAPILVRADIFAREGADILYAIGNVHIERGEAVITCDAAIVWTSDKEAYLEGHILYRTGKSVVEAERAFVRWSTVKDPVTGKEKDVADKGFLFNANVRWSERPDRITWHIRAEEVLQTDVRRFLARGALELSPCQFHEPHTFFRASEVELLSDEYIIATDLTYHVRGVSLPPIWVFPIYWPKLYIPLGWEFPQIKISAGSSSRFGFFIRTEMIYENPERLFGVLRNEIGVNLDYFSKRGFAYGMSFDYHSESRRDPDTILGRDLIRGRLEAYAVPHDRGEDFNEFDLGTTNRYRVKAYHSQDFPSGLELDVEYQRYSDAGFRQEYFPRDYESEKPIENRVYLKYPFGPAAAYFHARWSPGKWVDTTEYLPQVGFNVFSYPILGGKVLYTGHFELANIHRKLSVLRLKPGQLPTDPDYEEIRRRWDFFFDGDPDYPINPLESTPQEYLSDDRRLWRFNTYHQLAFPFDLSIFHFEPYAAWRGTYYSDTLDGGSGFRNMFIYGARVNTQFWRTWQNVRIERPWLDIHGVRHVITPELRFLTIEKPSLSVDKLILTDDTDFYQPPRDPGNAFPARPYRPWDPYALAFGDVDAIVPVRLINFALRNRWQTLREGRPADFLEITPNVTYYFDGDRDNWGRSLGDARIDTRISPIHGVYGFMDFGRKVCGDEDNEPHDVTFANSGVAIEVSDRWAFVFSQRYEKDYATLWAFRFLYNISPKWRFDVQYETNSERGATSNVGFRLTRDMHDWIVEFVFQNDSAGLQNLIGISLQPKSSRELISGLEYSRDLRAGLDAYYRESYLPYDY